MKKLTMNMVALGNLRHRRKQYTLMILGIVLALIFSGGVPFFLSAAHSSNQEMMHRMLGKQDVIMLRTGETEGKIEQLQLANMIEGETGSIHVLSYGWTENPEQGTAIGWLDRRGKELYYPQIRSGRMPEAQGEIALEEQILIRLFPESKLGDTVIFQEAARDGADYRPHSEKVSYRLVGILKDRKTNFFMRHLNAEKEFIDLPAAWTAPGTETQIGGRELLISLFNKQNQSDEENIYSFIHFSDALYDRDLSNFLDDSILTRGALGAFFAGLLALLSCFGIANAFNSNLKERKQQIGLLRAMGATRRQIILLFGREALLIALAAAPVSVGISYFAVWGFSKAMGDAFVFRPKIWILLASAAFGILCVMAAALIPLIAISRIPPMHAIRDTEMTRKMRHHKIRSQTGFQVSSLLAARKLTFHRGSHFAVILILAITVLISCVGFDSFYRTVKSLNAVYVGADYEVHLRGTSGDGNAFRNLIGQNPLISEAERQEVLEISAVQSVEGEKTLNVNLLIEGEFPPYLEVLEYGSWMWGTRFEASDPLAAMTKENIRSVMQSKPNPLYEEFRQRAGYSEELFVSDFSTVTEEELSGMEEYLIEGHIDREALDSGREILLLAPEKLGFMRAVDKNGSGWSSLRDISPAGLADSENSQKKELQYLLAEAESPFHAGDKLRFSILIEDTQGKLTREDREVTVGGIVRKLPHSVELMEDFGLMTTARGFETLESKWDYQALLIHCVGEATSETDAQMLRSLKALFPGHHVQSQYQFRQNQIQSLKLNIVTVLSLMLVLSAICISLINNHITGQIREGKRTIGTLRALGADRETIVRSFMLQICHDVLIGFLLGLGGLGCVALVFRYYGQRLYWADILPAFLLPAGVLLVSFLNLWIQIRKVSRRSIVENIREL